MIFQDDEEEKDKNVTKMDAHEAYQVLLKILRAKNKFLKKLSAKNTWKVHMECGKKILFTEMYSFYSKCYRFMYSCCSLVLVNNNM